MALGILFYIFLLKWRIKWGTFWFQCILWSSKILFCFRFKAQFLFFSNGHIHKVVSTLLNVVKIYVENKIAVSTLSNVVQINVEMDKVDSTLFNVINFKVDVRNVVSRLIWCCTTLRRHITLKTTLNRRLNVCWVRCFWKLCNIDRKAPVLESLLNKAADLKATNFTKKRLQHRGFPVNIAKFLRTPFFIEHLLCLVLLFKLIRLTCYSENAFFT